MKKILLIGLIIASMTLSCENVMNEQKTEEAKPQIVGYTDNGTPIMRVTIDVVGDTGRALTKEEAQAGVLDYYEVAFWDSSTSAPVTTTWGWSTKGSIDIPAVDYGDGSNKAILFAGREKDKLLIAVGEISAVNGVENTKDVTESSASVSFKLYPLSVNVTGVSATTSFKITAPNATTFPLGTYGSGTNQVMVYKVTKGAANIKADWKVDIVKASDGLSILPSDSGNIDGSIDESIVFAPENSTIFSRSSPANSTNRLVLVQNATSPDVLDNTAVPGYFPDNGIFKLNFDVPNTDGYIDIALEICVYPIRTVGSRWYIRGGYNNQTWDTEDPQSTGGAILLQIGNPPTTGGSGPGTIGIGY